MCKDLMILRDQEASLRTGEEWRVFQMRFKPDGKAAFFPGEEQADLQDS